MRLQIEEWAEKNLTLNAIQLMEEAATCYKVGAYRAAYLMSYLAFKQTIRDRILTASKPDTMDGRCWDEQIINPLDNDNKWEEKLNNIVAASKEGGKGEGAVFRFTNYERIRNRYDYWKNIRNSCAHAKDEHISSATVEQFWNYMQDDLPEFYVLGGKVYLTDRLCHSYKYFGSVGKVELMHILKEIALVYKRNTKQCFDDFYERDKLCLKLTKSNIGFWEVLIDTDNEIIRDSFIDFLYQHKDSFIEWYDVFPKLFKLMVSKHKSFIQEFLAPYIEKGYYIKEEMFWKLLYEILCVDVNLVNLEKITEDYNRFRIIEKNKLQENELEVLHKHRVFKKFLFNAGRDYFVNNSTSHWKYYSWESDFNDKFSETCFEYIEWDMEIVERIESAYEELDDSVKMRGNPGSKENGKKRMESYDRIIASHSGEILQIIKESKKEVCDYYFINDSLHKANISLS